MNTPRTEKDANEPRFSDTEPALMTCYRELAYITAALIDREAEVEEQARRINALEVELTQMQHALGHAQGIVHYHLTEQEAMRTSRSWRLMATIRRLGRVFVR
ncbi:hypothetical protein FIU94_05335 [Sulfitobacter sp. THAF37]|uniref:hypothetical protein n=1 Tax=Sulfitobacter sp. THAF37 TaxID=2587855 RepID=UPI0012693B54|nr:hypothetical protein [Sulfitobacter sp. THAF37]QFT58241.1 hypothetical protein FIU94_05335 [Sulfitobacter sp. THAF37]